MEAYNTVQILKNFYKKSFDRLRLSADLKKIKANKNIPVTRIPSRS